MIPVKIENLLGITRLEFEADTINVISGPNGSGKSTALLGIGAAASQDSTMGGRVLKKDRRTVISDGAKRADVTVGENTIFWAPSKSEAHRVRDTWSSLTAAGFDHPVYMSDNERKGFFAGLLGLGVTREQVSQALGQRIDKIYGKQVLSRIDRDGWDATVKYYDGERAYAAKRWCELSGNAKYGRNIAAEWRKGARMDIVAARKAEDAAVAVHKNAIEVAAVLANDRDKLTELASKLIVFDSERIRLELILSELDTTRKRWIEGKKHIPATQSCPSCGVALEVTALDDEIIEAEMSFEEKEAAVESNRKADDDIKAILKEMAGPQATLNGENGKPGLYFDLNAAGEAANTLKKMDDADGAEVVSVVEAKADLDAASEVIRLAKNQAEAREVLDTHDNLLVVLGAVSSGGIRKGIVGNKIETVNTEISSLSRFERPITVDENLNMFYAGRPYVFCSESEKWRVRFLIQLYVALKDGSKFVITDGADVLDTPGRDGLFKTMLFCGGMTFFIGMMANLQKHIPDMPQNGVKRVWIS